MPVKMTWNGDRVAASIKAKGAPLVRRIAEELEATAKAECPVRTGKLRDSITTEYDAGGLSASVVATAPHAKYVEYGTRKRRANRFLRRSVNKVGAKYMRGNADSG